MKIASLNCLSLRTDDKPLQLNHVSRTMNIDMVALQSCHSNRHCAIDGFTYQHNHHVGFAWSPRIQPLNPHVTLFDRIAVCKTDNFTIVCAYCPFSDTTEQDRFWDNLHMVLATCQGPTLLLGDMNASVNPIDLPDSFTSPQDRHMYPTDNNRNGGSLLDITAAHELRLLNFLRPGTYFSRITCTSILANNSGTIIDYAAVSPLWTPLPTMCVKQPRFNSDHRMLVLTLPRIPTNHHHVRHPTPTPPLAPPPIIGPMTQVETTYDTTTKTAAAIPDPQHDELRLQRHLANDTRVAIRRLHTMRRHLTQHNPAFRIQGKLVARLIRRDRTNNFNYLATQIQSQVSEGRLHEAYRSLRPWTRPPRRHTTPTLSEILEAERQFRELLTAAQPTRLPDRQTPDLPIRITSPPPPTIIIYTDGSYNQRQTIGYSVISIFPTHVSCCASGHTHREASSTRGEACAILAAMQQHRGQSICIRTDSQTCIDTMAGIRRRIANHMANTPNADIWSQIAKELIHTTVVLEKVAAHTGETGNELADTWAKHGCNTQQATHLDIPDLLCAHDPRSGTRVPDIIVTPGAPGPLPFPDYTPSASEIDAAISKLKNNKTSGPDGIPTETLKHPTIRPLLIQLITQIWEHNTIPQAWKQSTLIGIPKPTTGTRGITILPIMSKILTRLICDRHTDTPFHEAQHAFRTGRSALHAIIKVKHHLHVMKSNQDLTHAVFLDLRKAYDSVGRDTLDPLLTKYGFGPRSRSLILQLYEDEITFKMHTHTGTPFHSTVGVKQGCILSPMIFNMIMDQALLNTDVNPRVTTIAYADDLVIAGPDINEVSDTIRRITTELQHMGLYLNDSKCEYMVIGQPDSRDTLEGHSARLHKLGIMQAQHDPMTRDTALIQNDLLIPTHPWTGLRCPLKDCNYIALSTRSRPEDLLCTHVKRRHPHFAPPHLQIRVTHHVPAQHLTDKRRLHPDEHQATPPFQLPSGYNLHPSLRTKYLGYWISDTLTDEHDINTRSQAAFRSMYRLHNLWKSPVSVNFKSRIFKTIILPILTYSAGTWAPSKALTRTFAAKYHTMARRACNSHATFQGGIWTHPHPNRTLRRLHLPTARDLLREHRLRLFGQMYRLGYEIPEHTHHRRGKETPCWIARVSRDIQHIGALPSDAKFPTQWKKRIIAPHP